jgi:cation transport ATPase
MYNKIIIEQLFKCLTKYIFRKGVITMKKSYKIEVDCANCANLMEEAAKKTAGVKDAVVNFMTLKMNVEFAEGADPKAVMQDVLKNCKAVEEDCEIFL